MVKRYKEDKPAGVTDGEEGGCGTLALWSVSYSLLDVMGRLTARRGHCEGRRTGGWTGAKKRDNGEDGAAWYARDRQAFGGLREGGC